MTDFLSGRKHIHFIGIGGSGMYPLAQILHFRGFYLTGSDNNETETLKAVRNMGISVMVGHDAENIKGADLIIYSAAIMQDNPELAAAKAKKITVRERSELLGLVTSWFGNAVCVSGTHGKTTASSMLTHIFLACGDDISAVIGGKLKAIGGSGRIGRSQTMVCEACEFNDTFLKLAPDIAVILNIDEDHLDYFKTMDRLIASFSEFCGLATNAVVYNGDDPNSVRAVENSRFSGKRVTFGWSEQNQFYPSNIKKISDFQTDFALMQSGLALTKISIFAPGEHNVLNAVAACAAALTSGAQIGALAEGLKSFWGAGRRFERLYEKNGITIVDDYAHHPAEITATLKTAKAMNYSRVWAIHQPFTFSRTATMMNEFVAALSLADKITLTEIMGGREVNTYGVCAQDIADRLFKAKVYPSFDEIAAMVAKYAQPGDLIITMGCGDVYKVAHMLIELLDRRCR